MRLTLLFFVLFLGFIPSYAQFESSENYTRVVFYNVENMFDNLKDEGKRDDEYLPDGDRFWTDRKVKEKLHRMSKAILSTGDWDVPHIVGLCEVENRNILNMLLQQTPMSKYNYQILHQESPDRRGIDVALLYLKEKYTPIKTEFLEINFPDNSDRKTRDVLYSKGAVNDGEDTVHIFVNHWPSRWGGQLESEPGRMYLALVVKQKVDEILKENPKANIIIIGDFNDEPKNKSLYEVLNAREKVPETLLINLMLEKEGKEGTLKYAGKWGILDQIIVTNKLIFNEENTIHVKNKEAVIHRADFLLEEDKKDLGTIPFRTSIGFTYHGGFSDHLPVYIDLVK